MILWVGLFPTGVGFDMHRKDKSYVVLRLFFSSDVLRGVTCVLSVSSIAVKRTFRKSNLQLFVINLHDTQSGRKQK